MPFKHKELKGTLFENEEKKSPSHPDWKGKCTIEGEEYWVSCWESKTRNTGDPCLNLGFTKVEDQQPSETNPGSPGEGAF